MKKQLVTIEIANKLKELGFDEHCIGWYHPNDPEPELSLEMVLYTSKGVNKDNFTHAPLWQQAIDWLREKHEIEIWMEPSLLSYRYKLIFNDNKHEGHKLPFNESREAAILKALELI